MSHKLFIVVFFALSSIVAMADEYTERACNRVFSVNLNTLQQKRGTDTHFVHIDETCCCKDKILKLFRNRTEDENDRVNPATDMMLNALAEYEKTIRYTIKEVENLKQINAMYSMPEQVLMSPVPPDDEDNSTATKGCRPLDFSKEEDREAYLATVDQMENSGGGAGAYELHGERSSAFGRYQIMPATASDYCGKTPAEWGCCSNWQNSPQCQDEMFRLLTIANTQGLLSRGIPLNTCTVYLAHQQGLGGVYWLFGGNSPYANTEKLKEVVRANIGANEWNAAIASGKDLDSPDILREIYKDYWNERFGADILSSEGTEMPPDDFQIASGEFIEYANRQKALWREGILLELQQIRHNLKARNK